MMDERLPHGPTGMKHTPASLSRSNGWRGGAGPATVPCWAKRGHPQRYRSGCYDSDNAEPTCPEFFGCVGARRDRDQQEETVFASDLEHRCGIPDRRRRHSLAGPRAISANGRSGKTTCFGCRTETWAGAVGALGTDLAVSGSWRTNQRFQDAEVRPDCVMVGRQDAADMVIRGWQSAR